MRAHAVTFERKVVRAGGSERPGSSPGALSVNLKQLKEGPNRFEASVSAAELAFEDAEAAMTGPVRVKLLLELIRRKLVVRGRAEGEVALACGRCLEPYRMILKAEVAAHFRPADEGSGEGRDSEAPVYQGTTVDVTDEVRQALVLALPLKRICRTDCRGLCPACGENLNRRSCEHAES